VTNPFDDRALWVPKQSDDTLAKMQPPIITLAVHELDRIARLGLMLTQEEARRNPASKRIMHPAMLVPYEERTEESRAAMRTSVVRVLQALAMLGHIDVG
jgi:hypothetical protein